jgi:hypothetical protein
MDIFALVEVLLESLEGGGCFFDFSKVSLNLH